MTEVWGTLLKSILCNLGRGTRPGKKSILQCLPTHACIYLCSCNKEFEEQYYSCLYDVLWSLESSLTPFPPFFLLIFDYVSVFPASSASRGCFSTSSASLLVWASITFHLDYILTIYLPPIQFFSSNPPSAVLPKTLLKNSDVTLPCPRAQDKVQATQQGFKVLCQSFQIPIQHWQNQD